MPKAPVKQLHTRTGLQEQSSPCTNTLLLPHTGEPPQPHREKPKPHFKNQALSIKEGVEEKKLLAIITIKIAGRVC